MRFFFIFKNKKEKANALFFFLFFFLSFLANVCSEGRPGLSVTIPLAPGTHHLKFLVGKEMLTADHLPTAVDFENVLVNYIVVPVDKSPAAAASSSSSTARPRRHNNHHHHNHNHHQQQQQQHPVGSSKPIDIKRAKPPAPSRPFPPPGLHPPLVLPPTPTDFRDDNNIYTVGSPRQQQQYQQEQEERVEQQQQQQKQLPHGYTSGEPSDGDGAGAARDRRRQRRRRRRRRREDDDGGGSDQRRGRRTGEQHGDDAYDGDIYDDDGHHVTSAYEGYDPTAAATAAAKARRRHHHAVGDGGVGYKDNGDEEDDESEGEEEVEGHEDDDVQDDAEEDAEEDDDDEDDDDDDDEEEDEGDYVDGSSGAGMAASMALRTYTAAIPRYLRDLDAPEGSRAHRRITRAMAQLLPAPPALPGFLGRSILNSSGTRPKDDSSVLVMPNHTVLNHLATSSIKDGVLATSVTTRYQSKYLTTIMYKPTDCLD